LRDLFNSLFFRLIVYWLPGYLLNVKFLLSFLNKSLKRKIYRLFLLLLIQSLANLEDFLLSVECPISLARPIQLIDLFRKGQVVEIFARRILNFRKSVEVRKLVTGIWQSVVLNSWFLCSHPLKRSHTYFNPFVFSDDWKSFALLVKKSSWILVFFQNWKIFLCFQWFSFRRSIKFVAAFVTLIHLLSPNLSLIEMLYWLYFLSIGR